MDQDWKREKRMCRKCLLMDSDQEEYFENLRSYLRQLPGEAKAEEDLYQERLLICRECDFLYEAMCRACGCYVELRAAMKKNRCPYEKWRA